jgi:hypothetical protein
MVLDHLAGVGVGVVPHLMMVLPMAAVAHFKAAPVVVQEPSLLVGIL